MMQLPGPEPVPEKTFRLASSCLRRQPVEMAYPGSIRRSYQRHGMVGIGSIAELLTLSAARV